MAVDRIADWQAAVDAACHRAQLSEDAIKRVKASLILKPVKRTSPFRQVVDEVQASIAGLRAFIEENKRDYVAAAGRFTPQQKDKIEEEVLQTVTAARARIDQLTKSAAAAGQRGGGGAQQQQQRAAANADTVAHLHGTVLVLVEALQQAGATFDKCRAVRHAQQMAEDARRQQRRAASHTAPTLSGPAASATSGAYGGSSQQLQQGGGGGQQQQQQQMYDRETQQLLEDLMRSTNQVEQVERTVREITTMQQMISTAVMEQAEAIEQLYNVAVEATGHIRRGNEDLRKTIAVNRSGTLYIVVLLLTASAMLLLFDWVNS